MEVYGYRCDICGVLNLGSSSGFYIKQVPLTLFKKDCYELCPDCAKKLRNVLKKASKTGEFDDFPLDDDK